MDAALISAELKKIEDRKGRLTPDAVLEEASAPKHPLHAQFEWDDSVAAHKHRLLQARELINSVRVEFVVNERTVRAVAYVRDPSVGGEQGYRSVTKLVKDADDSRAAVIAEFARAAGHLRRARDLAVVLGCADEVDDLVGRIETIGSKIEHGTASAA